jgi:hypothetical protein
MSHLPGNKPFTAKLTTTRGRRANFTVEPLADEKPAPQLKPITPETVAEFERDIAAAKTIQELDAVGADLKAWDLGSYREKLQTAWGDRRSAIKAGVKEPETQVTEEN